MGNKDSKETSLFKALEKEAHKGTNISKHAQKIWNYFDLDKSGVLEVSKGEAEAFFTSLWDYLAETNPDKLKERDETRRRNSAVSTWIEFFDENKDGNIQFSEFNNALVLITGEGNLLMDDQDEKVEEAGEGGEEQKAGGPVLTPPTDEELKEKVLAAHTRWRAAVGLPPLEWDDELAKSAAVVAADNAKRNGLKHSTRGGENLWGGTGFDVTGWVDAWGAEIKDFDADSGRVFPKCCKKGKKWHQIGHYTQVVWKNTTKVGGAWVRSDKGKGLVYFCCHYDPVGNECGKVVY